MKLYELTYLVSSEVSEEELKNLREKINSLIQKEGGVLDQTSLSIRKRLASPIKKRSDVFLAALNFHLQPEKLEILEKELKPEGQILRYCIFSKTTRGMKKGRLERRRMPRQPLVEKTTTPKVELKEIEKKLDEILGV